MQRSGISSLGRLAQHGGVAWGAASLGAVHRILRALELHRSAELQAVGLWALGRLAERVQPAALCGLQDAALRAQRLHPESALVQRHAVRPFRELKAVESSGRSHQLPAAAVSCWKKRAKGKDIQERSHLGPCCLLKTWCPPLWCLKARPRDCRG